MTTLYDPPAATYNDYYESESDQEEGDEMANFDLDVVDDALLNPTSSEYLDHFGFKIHVRTDDESSSDDDSDYNESDDEKGAGPLNDPNNSSSTTTTTATSDDDSVDTNLTTPHPHSHNPHENQKWLSDDTTDLSKSDYQISSVSVDSSNQSNSDPKDAGDKVPILKSPPAAKADSVRNSVQIDTTHTDVVRSSKDTQRSSISRHSIISSFNNRFKARPSSVTSIQSPAIISRPSQSFQKRQSKRFSEALPINMIGAPQSPTSNHRHFGKLVSKFRRFSHNDHRYDSEKHTLLKQEALAEMNRCREKGGIENNRINWGFWEQVADNFGAVIDTQMDDLRQHLAKGGIPSPIRGLLWQIISKSRDSFDMETEYREILKKSTSPFEKQIQRDLTRTFPEHPYFMQESGRQALFNVAKAYSIFDQEVGYCQGLAFIIGCLLLHMSEESAFCVLIKLMGKYGLRGHFTPRMEALHQHMYQFDNVFQQKLPVIHRHMENEGVTPSMYASQWFITLFAYRCPIELTLRVIDLLLVEGTHILVQIALAIIIRNQEKILRLKFESLVEFLGHGVFANFGEDGNAIVEDTYRIDLPARFMARLAQQYTEEEARESKSISQEDNLRRINGQLSEHIRSVEASLQLLRVENQDITKQIIDSKMTVARTEDEKQQISHELARVKAEFEQYKKDVNATVEKQLTELVSENKDLAQQNLSLANQLTDTEAMLINMKLSFAERESEFEAIRRQLKDAKKL
ncbi:hypothetical protein [Parasitella parasitica]|uniref:Rab-GAP TBC domain-containing protein n=1 Tax=Parasitella parasitica TaxID=35722 RepID=A0A0B7N757_9FUNG|nr:hypothetical protein [Parasitella parasitica]